VGYEERKDLYEKLEKIRMRPLLVYITSNRRGASGQIGSDVVPLFMKQLNKIPAGEEKVDLLVVSSGGDPIVSWRIMSLLRERFSEVSVILPYIAYSAATLLALGSDELLMHPYSNLGPVDAQLHAVRQTKEGNEQKDFPVEDLNHFIDFMKENVGITDQTQLGLVVEQLCKETTPLQIAAAKRFAQLSSQLSEKLLGLHMKDQNKIKAISDSLNHSFLHHGYPVDRNEAKRLGLPVELPTDEEADIMWGIWEDFEKEMDINTPFIPLNLILSDPNMSYLTLTTVVNNLPVNIPPQLQTPLVNLLSSQLSVTQIQPVQYELFLAALESTYTSYSFRVSGIINALRRPDSSIALNVFQKTAEWV